MVDEIGAGIQGLEICRWLGLGGRRTGRQVEPETDVELARATLYGHEHEKHAGLRHAFNFVCPHNAMRCAQHQCLVLLSDPRASSLRHQWHPHLCPRHIITFQKAIMSFDTVMEPEVIGALGSVGPRHCSNNRNTLYSGGHGALAQQSDVAS